MVWFLHANTVPITPLVSGVQDGSDPNHPIEIYYGNSTYSSANDMLDGLGVIVYPEDKFAVFPDPALKMGSKLEIQRALPVMVTDAKALTTYRTWASDVQGLFSENNIVLLGQDSAEPGLSTPLTPEMAIKITRVAEVDVTETVPIDFKIVKKLDNTLEKGSTKIIQKGIAGEKSVIYTIKRVDGVQVSKILKSTSVSKQPQDQIIIVGTKVVVYGIGEVSWYRSSAMAAKNQYYAASHTLPKGTVIWLVNTVNGKGVKVVVLDYMANTSRLLDISPDAFCAIGQGKSCDDNLYNLGILKNVRAEKYYPSSN